MSKGNKHSEDSEENRPPSSPVCYAGLGGLRPEFSKEESHSDESESDKANVHATSPDQIPSLFADAWMKRDAELLASLFDSDAEFVNVVGLWWHNRASIQKAHAYGLRVIFNNSTLEVVKTKVRYLRDDIAVVNAKMKLTGQTALDSDQKETGTRRSIFTFVTRRTNEFWICVSAQNTEIINGAETFISSDGIVQPADYRKV